MTVDLSHVISDSYGFICPSFLNMKLNIIWNRKMKNMRKA